MAKQAAKTSQEVENTESESTVAADSEQNPDKDSQSLSWTASEFVHHEKSVGWYLSLVIIAVLIAAGVFLLTRDIVSVVVVIVAAGVLAFYASHQPRQLEYTADQNGIQIGHKFRSYDEFKSFSVVPEGAFSSIVFMPLKRFAPATTIYYPPEDEDKILAILSNQLPYEEPRRDAVDNLMRRIRF